MTNWLPRSALRAGAEALQAHLHCDEADPWRDRARVVLLAALPAIERHVQRQMAIRILELDALDRQRTSNKGPYYDMRTSLRRLARGEPLPEIPQDQVRQRGEEGNG
jgi:hypothetical protein